LRVQTQLEHQKQERVLRRSVLIHLVKRATPHYQLNRIVQTVLLDTKCRCATQTIAAPEFLTLASLKKMVLHLQLQPAQQVHPQS